MFGNHFPALSFWCCNQMPAIAVLYAVGTGNIKSIHSEIMKKILMMALVLLCAGSLTVNAAARRQLTDEQKKLQKELLEKYDANKDGKLDKEEKGKMTAEDKEKL